MTERCDYYADQEVDLLDLDEEAAVELDDSGAMHQLPEMLIDERITRRPLQANFIRATMPIKDRCVRELFKLAFLVGLDIPNADVPVYCFLDMFRKNFLRVRSLTDDDMDLIPQSSKSKIYNKVDILVILQRTDFSAFGTLIPQPWKAIRHIVVDNIPDAASMRPLFNYMPEAISVTISFNLPISLSSVVQAIPPKIKTLSIPTMVSDIPEGSASKLGNVTSLALGNVSSPFKCHIFSKTRTKFECLAVGGSNQIYPDFFGIVESSSTKLQVLDLSDTNLLTNDLLLCLGVASSPVLRILI
jgi:hypothetical protein